MRRAGRTRRSARPRSSSRPTRCHARASRTAPGSTRARPAGWWKSATSRRRARTGPRWRAAPPRCRSGVRLHKAVPSQKRMRVRAGRRCARSRSTLLATAPRRRSPAGKGRAGHRRWSACGQEPRNWRPRARASKPSAPAPGHGRATPAPSTPSGIDSCACADRRHRSSANFTGFTRHHRLPATPRTRRRVADRHRWSRSNRCRAASFAVRSNASMAPPPPTRPLPKVPGEGGCRARPFAPNRGSDHR